MKWLLLLAFALEASAQRFKYQRTTTGTPLYREDAIRQSIRWGPLKLVGKDVRFLIGGEQRADGRRTASR
jgi:hypothetical protein